MNVDRQENRGRAPVRTHTLPNDRLKLTAPLREILGPRGLTRA